MCGFVGFVDKKTKKQKELIVKKMGEKIIHRGPDSEGIYADKDIAMCFRRLSIIDLEGGSQPIWNEDNTMFIMFNGEIYNYQALKDELISKGHIFKTKTDTEVILHGYEEWKDDLYDKLRGMFAFVIYNVETKEMIGARDHFGIKPFYYYKKNDLFCFGSEIKSFLEHPDFEKEVNKNALKMYLIFQYSVHEETFFKNTFKLKPGHYFKYKNGEMITTPFFEIDYQKEDKPYDEFKREAKAVLENSVKYHQMTSDVEVGSYLSGGVDSSYVVAVAKPDKTFSVGFDEDKFDETMYAKELSKLLDVKNFSKKISKEEYFEMIPKIIYHTDEPHANLSTVPLYFLSKLANEQVKVVLSGEGADEMFAGYNEYNDPAMLRFYIKLPLGLRRGIRNIVKKLPRFPGQNTLIKYGLPFEERYIGHGSFMESEEANLMLADDLKSNENVKDLIRPCIEKLGKANELTKKLYVDMHFWLPQDILLKADKMTMANSLELRVPLLDIELFRMAKRIPTNYLIKDNETKYIFRDIAGEKMPEEWKKRRKCGFPVPFSKWIREEAYYNKVKVYFEKEYVSEFFDKKYINQLLEEHYKNIKNNGRKIYNIYIFLVWYEVYFEEKIA